MYKDEKILNYVFKCANVLKLGKNKLTRKNNGTLALPTGKIVAADPLTIYDKEPFSVVVAPGRYPCSVYLDDCERVALAALFFTEKEAIKWEMALIGKENVSKLKDGGFYGYGVDAGTGSFMDQKIVGIIENMEGEGLFGVIDGENYVNYTLEPEDFEGEKKKRFIPDLNVVMFSCDDGMYPSYFGYDEDGNVCCLVTDFMSLGNNEAEAEVCEIEGNSEPDLPTLVLPEVDLSIMDDDSPKPFLFIGAGTGSGEASYCVRFEKELTKSDQAQIIKLVYNSIEITAPHFLGNVMTITSNNIPAIIKWLLQLHTNFPIHFIVETNEKVELSLSKWHYQSLESDKLLKLMFEIKYGHLCDKGQKFLYPLLLTISKYAEKHLNDEMLLKLYPSYYAEKFIKNRKKVQVLKDVIRQYIGKDSPQRMISELGNGVYGALDGKKLNEEDVYDVMKLLLNPASPQGTMLNADYWAIKIIVNAVDRNDSEFLNYITTSLNYCINLDYLIPRLYLETVNNIQREKKWQTVIKIYQYIFDLRKNKKPIIDDLSIYNNALYVLQSALSGFVNEELNAQFLSACLPYAKKNPDIYYNATILYVEMKQYEKALECIKHYLASAATNKEQVLDSIKTLPLYDDFRNLTQVQKIIQ